MLGIIILSVVSVAMIAIGWWLYDNFMDARETLGSLLRGFGWFFVGIALILGLVALCVNWETEATLVCEQERYKSLVYQVENDVYDNDNDNDIGKQELYKEVTTWNRSVAYGKVMQSDIWWGILIPDIYDQLETIDLSAH